LYGKVFIQVRVPSEVERSRGPSYISDSLLSQRVTVKARFARNKAGKVSNLKTHIVREEVAEFGKKPDFFGSGIGEQGNVDTFVKTTGIPSDLVRCRFFTRAALR
jgi:hypothetical protein